VHPERVLDAASERVSPTAAFAAFGHVCPTLHQPVLPLDVSLLQQPVLPLDMSVLHQPVLQPELPLDVSFIQQPVLSLDVSAHQTVVIRDTNRKKQAKQSEFRFFSVQTENIFCLF
jgi:hypothetical protein